MKNNTQAIITTEQKEFNFYENRWKLRDFYFKKVLSRHICEKYFHKYAVMPVYAGKKVLSADKANTWIAERINSGKPLMVSRFGNTELQIVIAIMKLKLQGRNEENIAFYDKWFERLNYGAGFFPPDKEMVEKFSEVLLASCKEADILAMWHCNMEDYVIKKYMKNTRLTYLTRIEPWNCSNPWTHALKGKRVLVIHPFEDSIKEQYFNKRELLFDDKRILPEFELITLKAVQTMAEEEDSRFENWFEALEWMYEEAMKIDFDVAIIGCGAYGMPLAAKIKQAGKQAIHMGGVTQILFGIKGKRWVENPCFRLEFNENWIYPKESETPKGSERVENNCYWG